MKKPIRQWPGTGFLSRSTSHGRLALTGRNVSVMDTQTRARLAVSHPLSYPSSYDFSPDGSRMAVKSTSGQIVIVDPPSGAVVRDFKNKKEGEGSNLCFSPDGDYIVDGSWGGIVSIRSVSETGTTYREEYWNEMISVISHDKHRQLWMVHHKLKASGSDGHAHPGGYVTLRSWPLNTATPRVFSFGIDIKHARLSPDGNLIAFYGTDYNGDCLQRLYIASSADDRILVQSAAYESGGTRKHITWSDDCRHIIAVVKEKFVVLDTETLRTIREIPSQYPACATFIDNGDTLVLGDWMQTRLENMSDIVGEPTGVREPSV